MNSNTNIGDIPLGLAENLMKNSEALRYFAMLPQAEKENVIESTHRIHSKAEMQAFVNEIAKQSGFTQNKFS